MNQFATAFRALRDKIIERDFGRMNEMQLRAVTSVRGPVLVLAGAGSGKTTVLVNRIACLIKYGIAYGADWVPDVTEADLAAGEAYLSGAAQDLPERLFSLYPPRPWEILAITFTNKAAGELKDRIGAMLGDTAGDIWAGTFHSVCGRILRRFSDRLGYTSHFTIYDADDQRRLMKQVLKELEIDEKILPHRSVLNEISHAKDQLISPAEYAARAGEDFRRKKIAEAYIRYQARLEQSDAMDFDDMIAKTVDLLENNEDVLEYYQEHFRYIMVDEYQDTNHAQYKFVQLLAQKYRNICVVGDDDQSIYRFRGATIENILSFETEYPDAQVIRLEQNYRSTSTILDAANAVIAHNKGRKGKSLWTRNGVGDKIEVFTASDEQLEARFVADTILEAVRTGGKFSDHAVLYRMNAQSNALENVFVRSGIPYRIIGGFRFFERKEVKDALSYLSVINNPADAVRLRRIINEPKRGIGETSMAKASEIAGQLGKSLFEVLAHAEDYPALSRAAGKMKEFCRMIEGLMELSETCSIHELLEYTLDRTGYMAALQAEGKDAEDRIDNVNELSSTILNYEKENDDPTLAGFLEEIALFSDIDNYDAESDAVVLMTIHSAKGLEFDQVYLVGMEDGVFPSNQCIFGGESELEEERRLAYVAITRAKRRLYITNAYTRMLYGSTGRNRPSRFLKEIPETLCHYEGQVSDLLADALLNGPQARYGSAAKGYASGYAASYYSSGSANSGRYGANSDSIYRKGYAMERNIDTKKADLTGAVKNSETYAVGERVQHKTFGEGLVLSITPMGGDTLLEIAFDRVGTKKLMSNFAKLQKLA